MTTGRTAFRGLELSTDRLRLRRFVSTDAEELFKLDSDPDVMRFITGGAGTPQATIERQILPRFVREQDEAGIFGFWAAEQSNSFIGWFSLRVIDGLPGEAALGYRLCRRSWGHGLATEGARLLVDRGFRLGKLLRVIATTYEANLGSIRVMQKLGMSFERCFHLDAASIDAMDTAEADPANAFPGVDVEYAIDRDRWLATERTG